MAHFIIAPAGLDPTSRTFRWYGLALLAAGWCCAQPASAPPNGRDVRHTYFSTIDRTEQPYRLYVPEAYDGSRPFPLVIALHGTGGNENSLFEDQRIPPDELKRVAEKHGVLMVCPLGRGTTEYRGIGENDIFCVLADLRKRYRIDPDRIYLTGQSMGGTGAAYLALHHPDIFAAAAPLAAADSFPWLAANGRHVPFRWIQGAREAAFNLAGVAVGVERMRRLDQDVRHDLIPDEGHPAGLVRIDSAVGWLVQHRRVAHPRDYVFEVDTPLHGRAYWTNVTAMVRPGKIAVVRARAEGAGHAVLELENIAAMAFFPDPEVFDLSQPVQVSIGGATVYRGPLKANQQLRLVARGAAWEVALEPRREVDWTAYRVHPVAVAPEALDNRGTESRLANWITDAMREATDADIAIYNRVHDRGLGIPEGTVDIVDVIQCSLPFDQYLVTAELSGRELLTVLDASIPDPAQLVALAPERRHMNRLLQVSGMRYAFDPDRPVGQRIVSSDLQTDRVYRVVMEWEVVQRQTASPVEFFKQLTWKATEGAFTMALYGHAATKGRIEASIEGRVRQVGPR